METIEERACKHYPKQREFRASYRCGLIDGKREGYIKGAIEQKEIDLEKMIDFVENMPQDLTRQNIIDGLIQIIE